MSNEQAKNLPAHIGIIMDGNGRWATRQGLDRQAGHKAGAETVRRVVTACRERGIGALTLYAFSQENWARPQAEVSFLFGQLVDFLSRELPTLQNNQICLKVFGDASALPLAARKGLDYAIKKSAGNSGMNLNLALNYSGREEIVQACRKIIKSGLKPEALNAEKFKDYLYSAGQPDPDLIIRTSGEYRISNFLLYQSAYSEYYFTEVLWPDFTAQDLDAALLSFAGRTRRFGR